MDAGRLVKVRLSPSVVARFFPFRSPGIRELDRVEAAFLASLGLADVEAELSEPRDHAAFLVLHNLSGRRFFRVKYPFVEVLAERGRINVYPMFPDEKINPEVLAEADAVAVVEPNGDVIYYEVGEANL